MALDISDDDNDHLNIVLLCLHFLFYYIACNFILTMDKLA